MIPFYTRYFSKAKCIALGVFAFILSGTTAFAEGSKEVTANGGYRAYLLSGTTSSSSFPFPTYGTMKVYVKAGETINLGSSAQGAGSGTINLRAPDGTTYTSGSSNTVGLIANRSQELAGALPNAGGYTPFTITVKTGQDGIWEVDFMSPIPSSGANPTPILASAAWTQPASGYVAAFDVTVRNTGGQDVPGRVFTNVFSGLLGAFNIGFNGVFNILTKDGYQYVMNNNGQAGDGFTFFVNNRGFETALGSALYQSVNAPVGTVQDPRLPDTQADITHKIFFNTPSSDLPASAPTPGGGTTWLLNTPVTATVSAVQFIGREGTVGKAGTSPLGANFVFTATTTGTYNIAIDVNRNGVYNDPVDRVLTGSYAAGSNQIFWDGLNGQGVKVPASLSSYTASCNLQSTAGEVHFPFFDVERNTNGIVLTRTNGIYAPDDTVYWDDSQILPLGTPSNPRKNLTGQSSHLNGHIWGTTTTDPNDDQDFGNNKSIDTWSYIRSGASASIVSFQLQEADLAITDIIATAGCAGKPVSYIAYISNNGPNDVSGAPFKFNYTADVGNLTVTSQVLSGTASILGGKINATDYSANLNLSSGATLVLTIQGTISKTATAPIPVSASVLRLADMTDPDATNPDAAPPTDPTNECNSAPSGTGCNNIFTVNTPYTPTPIVGAGQTVYQYTSVTIAVSNGGTWSQSATDLFKVAVNTPTANTITVNNLDNIGLYHFINTNVNGCGDTVTVSVIAPDMNIPNIFTPNNDGKNDVFKIKDIESYVGSQLIVFNRWGNEVYRSDNYLNNWDGGNLAEGTYYYLLNRREHSGTITPIKGWVFIKRKK